MSAQRISQLGLRRAAVPNFRAQPAGRMLQRRLANTQSATETSTSDIIAKQRLQRPVSPHLSIYKPQITWYGSALNRVTAVALSGGLYLGGIAYLVAPTIGWHLESPSMIAAVAAWPVWVKVSAKATIAMTFFYHCLNGLRHLSWDFGYAMKNTTVRQTGWAVVAASAVLSVYYAFVG